MSDMTRRDWYICAAMAGGRDVYAATIQADAALAAAGENETGETQEAIPKLALSNAALAFRCREAEAEIARLKAAAGEREPCSKCVSNAVYRHHAESELAKALEQVAHYMAEAQDLRAEIARLKRLLEPLTREEAKEAALTPCVKCPQTAAELAMEWDRDIAAVKARRA